MIDRGIGFLVDFINSGINGIFHNFSSFFGSCGTAEMCIRDRRIGEPHEKFKDKDEADFTCRNSSDRSDCSGNYFCAVYAGYQ